jgi:hypothetical protein
MTFWPVLRFSFVTSRSFRADNPLIHRSPGTAGIQIVNLHTVNRGLASCLPGPAIPACTCWGPHHKASLKPPLLQGHSPLEATGSTISGRVLRLADWRLLEVDRQGSQARSLRHHARQRAAKRAAGEEHN